MRILLDECVSPKVGPALLALLPPGSSCDHVRRVGLSGKSNGELHDEALAAGYDALVTTDMRMQFQTPARLPVVVVPADSGIRRIAPYLDEAVELLTKPLDVAYHAIVPHAGTPEWKRLQARARRRRTDSPSSFEED